MKKHTPPRSLPTIDAMRASVDRFWKQVNKLDGERACWEWTGAARDADGAALWIFNYQGGRYRIHAHRASAILHGLPVRDSEDIVYRDCRNILCVRHEHLLVGDHEDNIRSRQRAGNQAKGENNGRAKLTEQDVVEIKLALRKGVTNRELAEIFGVDKRAIWGIGAGRVWKHVDAKRSV